MMITTMMITNSGMNIVRSIVAQEDATRRFMTTCKASTQGLTGEGFQVVKNTGHFTDNSNRNIVRSTDLVSAITGGSTAIGTMSRPDGVMDAKLDGVRGICLPDNGRSTIAINSLN